MKAIMLTVGVEDNEYPEGGVLLECPEDHPVKSETPFLLITARYEGLDIERIKDLRQLVIRGEIVRPKIVPDSMWDFAYHHSKKYTITEVSVATFLIDKFDSELLFHALLGFPKSPPSPENMADKPAASP